MAAQAKAKVVAIVGPTASGKTSLSIELAKQFDGEVVSADSRQVYRSLDIGTGKVSVEEMAGVPHHLLDIKEPDGVYTGADFLKDATTAIDDILKRGKLPIIAGGTFFYIELLRGTMQPAPVEPNPELRERLEDIPTDVLFKTLEAKDPRRALTIDPENRRRLIRALEIVDALGAVPEPEPTESSYDMLLLGVEREKEDLRGRFAKRLETWLKAGFRQEVEGLIKNGISKERIKELGFEYTLMLSFMSGEIDEAELKQRFIEKNWQYAKRQLTWLKRDPAIEWFRPEDRDAVFRRVSKFLGEG